MGTYITFPDLLIWLPLLGACACFLFGKTKTSKPIAVGFSLLILSVMIISYFFRGSDVYHINMNNVNYIWLKYLGANYYIGLDDFASGVDGYRRTLLLLTSISFPLILIATNAASYAKAARFFGLMLLAQAGIMGVFMAKDAFTFYFFWELALIPVYFLASIWGGEKRIQATFKFFVYTFIGSLLMLIGIIYIYLQTDASLFGRAQDAKHLFALDAFYAAAKRLPALDQYWLFGLFFSAFAIKMPIFPFHTWQPQAYDQAPTPVTMVMSGLMVKMGLFGVLFWLIPMFPAATGHFRNVIIILSVIGIIYASLLAMVQDNIKRLVAYSSIAHIGLMCASLFAMNEAAYQGVLLQMFNHGINIIGMWVVVDVIERKTGVKKLSELGGLAKTAPALTILLVIIALANIALPLTNAFPGEFLMLSGLYTYNRWFAAAAGIGVILSAVYTLNMIQKVFYGSVNEKTANVSDIAWHEKMVLWLIVGGILFIGICPQYIIDLSQQTVIKMLFRIN